MPPATDRVTNIADAAVDALVDNWPGDAAAALPERQYFTFGNVAWDQCEQLAVSVEKTFGVTGSLSGAQSLASRASDLRGVLLAVWLIRCVTNIEEVGQAIEIASPAELEADARRVLDDVVAATNCLIVAQKAGKFGGACSGVAYQGWTAAGPEGNFGGGVTRVRIEF